MSCFLVSLLAAGALADYPYYTDYTNYNSVYTHADLANLSRAKVVERTFDLAGEEPIKVIISATLQIPVPIIDSTLSIKLPFTWEFGGQTARIGGNFPGRLGIKHGTQIQNKKQWSFGVLIMLHKNLYTNLHKPLLFQG